MGGWFYRVQVSFVRPFFLNCDPTGFLFWALDKYPGCCPINPWSLGKPNDICKWSPSLYRFSIFTFRVSLLLLYYIEYYWVLNVFIVWMIEWKPCCLHSFVHLNLTLRFLLRISEQHLLVSNVLYSSRIQRVRIRCHFLCAPSLTYDRTSGFADNIVIKLHDPGDPVVESVLCFVL